MPVRAVSIPTSTAPSGPAGGDLSGTYPNPTVASLAGTTPTAFGLDLLDTGNASEGRDTLELGSSATLDAQGVTPTYGTRRVLAIAYFDLCPTGAVADLIASPISGTAWANTTNITASKASNGTITLTRNTTSASEDRDTGTMPHFTVPLAGLNFSVFMRANNTGNADFELFGIWLRLGGTTAIGFNLWRTTIELWGGTGATSSTPAARSTSITQDQYIWMRLEVRGASVAGYYSTSTSEPARDNIGATAASQWVLLGDLIRNGQAGPPSLAIGTWNSGSFGQTITITSGRLELH